LILIIAWNLQTVKKALCHGYYYFRECAVPVMKYNRPLLMAERAELNPDSFLQSNILAHESWNLIWRIRAQCP
jgi:hypothetical protein